MIGVTWQCSKPSKLLSRKATTRSTPQRAVVHARYSGLIAGLLELADLGFVAVLAAPSHAERRVGEHEIEAELRLGEPIARFATA